MFGTPFLVPHKVLHGEDFARPAAPKLLEMLFSDRGGLFATCPVALVMILALPFAWRRARPWVLSAIIVGILSSLFTAILLGRLNKVYGTPGKKPDGVYHGNVGFIVE